MKTTELYVTLGTDVAILASALQGSLPPKWAAICGVIANLAYALSRGIAKQGSPPAPPAPPA